MAGSVGRSKAAIDSHSSFEPKTGLDVQWKARITVDVSKAGRSRHGEGTSVMATKRCRSVGGIRHNGVTGSDVTAVATLYACSVIAYGQGDVARSWRATQNIIDKFECIFCQTAHKSVPYVRRMPNESLRTKTETTLPVA